MPFILYYHPLSSFCHKVMIAMHEQGIVHERRLIDLGSDAGRADLAKVWPLTKFPVLHDTATGRNVPESSIIIEYLDAHGDGSKLIPTVVDDALDVRLWDRIFDDHVQAPMQAIVADRLFQHNADMSRQRDALHRAYGLVDARMHDREWIAGAAFSMADCAAVPALFYAMTIEPFPEECLHLAAYFERLCARASVQAVLTDARPYFGMYPFAASIPPRFR